MDLQQQEKRNIIEGIASKLGGFRLFEGCSAGEIARIISCFDGVSERFEKGKVVVHEGMAAKHLMLVLEGVLDLYDPSMDGGRILIRTFERGDFLGMSLAMSPEEERYPCMITAATDVEMLLLDVEKVRESWYKPGFGRFFMNLFHCFSEYVTFTRDKLEILSCRNADDRILIYLRQRAKALGTNEFTVPFSTTELMADYLGITRTSLSRSIAALVRSGKIEHTGKGRFAV